jgi:hypothetical protein
MDERVGDMKIFRAQLVEESLVGETEAALMQIVNVGIA